MCLHLAGGDAASVNGSLTIPKLERKRSANRRKNLAKSYAQAWIRL